MSSILQRKRKKMRRKHHQNNKFEYSNLVYSAKLELIEGNNVTQPTKSHGVRWSDPEGTYEHKEEFFDTFEEMLEFIGSLTDQGYYGLIEGMYVDSVYYTEEQFLETFYDL